jgi:hypothetical protein
METETQQQLAVNQGGSQAELLAGIAETVLLKGDLKDLSPTERVNYYLAVCQSMGLNPLTKPFDYLETDTGLKLYPNKDCASQLRNKHNVSVRIVSREIQDQIFVVTCQAALPNGRTDESIGAVGLQKELGEWKTTQNGKKYFVGNGNFKPLAPDARANQVMRAETKAKRRATLSICGLGMLDSPEGESDDAPRWEFDLLAGTQGTAAVNAATDNADNTSNTTTQQQGTGDPQLDHELLQFVNATREQRLGKFQSLKNALVQMLGEEEGLATYYRVLKEADVEHAWQLKSMNAAKAVFIAMFQILRAGVPVKEEVGAEG